MDPKVNNADHSPITLDQIKALFDDQTRRMDEFEQRITKRLEEMSQMKQGQQESQSLNKHIVIDQDTVEGMQSPTVLSIDMHPLDIKNFAVQWPKWCDQFKVYVATNYDDALDDKEKLKIFLKFLDKEGETLALSLFSKKEYNQDAEIFDEVWWRMSESWDVAKDVDQDRRRITNILDKRRLLLQNSAEEIEKDPVQWALLIPHLSLCELEYVAKVLPRLERAIRNYSRTFGVRIEKCCLEKYPIHSHTDKDVFAKYEFASSVTLVNLPESDARGVLQVFKNIKRFGMHNMIIIDDISRFPGQLSELTLVDCQIEKELMEQWLSLSKSTLRRLCLDNFKHSFKLQLPKQSFYSNPNAKSIDLEFPSDQLQSLSIKRNEIYGNFKFESEVRSLSMTSQEYQHFGSSNLTHLCLNVDSISTHVLSYLKEKYPNLKFLMTKIWIPLEEIRLFASLKYLWIMCPVEYKYKSEIEQLKIKTVVVHYEHVPDPEEPNLIFDMLNEYCLLEITDYLSVPDWMRFGQMHWKIEKALVSFKYPRVNLEVEDIITSGISVDSDHFNYLAQFVTKCEIQEIHLLSKFSSLKSWKLWDSQLLMKNTLDRLPSRLEKLVVSQMRTNIDLQPYFQKLNSTLKVLVMDESPGPNGFSKLNNLREIEIYANDNLNDDLMTLKRNSNLHRIQITFTPNNIDLISHVTIQQISEMKQLKDLSIIYSTYVLPWSGPSMCPNILTDLLTTVEPKLTTLRLSGCLMSPEVFFAAESGILSNIQEFRMDEAFDGDNILVVLQVIRSMTSLKKLFFDVAGSCDTHDASSYGQFAAKYYKIFQDSSEFLEFIKEMPHLVELEMPPCIHAIRIEMELREYLKETNRKLRINKIEFP